VPGDPTVKRLVELYKKLEDAAKEGSAIKGWHPLRFNRKGWVVAGKKGCRRDIQDKRICADRRMEKSCRILGAGERAQSASVFPHDSGTDGPLYNQLGLPSLKEVVKRQQEEGSSNYAQ
jgi:hypothetical protein